MARKRGRIILVGVAACASHADFYAKELKLQVSCSYGPGRYDPDYESPAVTTRCRLYAGRSSATLRRYWSCWQRRLSVEPLCRIDSRLIGPDAYAALLDDPGALAILLTYDPARVARRIAAGHHPRAAPDRPAARTVDNPGVAVIGGKLRPAVFLPALQDAARARDACRARFRRSRAGRPEGDSSRSRASGGLDGNGAVRRGSHRHAPRTTRAT